MRDAPIGVHTFGSDAIGERNCPAMLRRKDAKTPRIRASRAEFRAGMIAAGTQTPRGPGTSNRGEGWTTNLSNGVPTMTKAKLFCGAAALAFAAALAAPTPSLAFHGGGHGGGHMGGAHMGGGMHMNGAMHMNAGAGGTHFAGTAGGARVAGTGTWHGGHTAWNGGGRWH